LNIRSEIDVPTKIVYNILAYRDPEVVSRLINTINTDQDFIYVHFDTMIGKEKFKQWKDFIAQDCQATNVTVVSEFRVKYASFWQIKAMLSAMKHYEKYNYDYFINLFPDSYPLKPLIELKNELSRQNCSYMEVLKLPYEGWYKGGLQRLTHKHYFFPVKGYPFVHILSVPRLKKGLPCGLEPYGGRGSNCLKQEHAKYVLEYSEKNPEVTKFFTSVYAPDELYFQTVLMNSSFKSQIIKESILYVDFSEGTSHPKRLTSADIPCLKESGKFFARRFDSKLDNHVLDRIDQEMLKS
jgi:hypothetical protein